MNSLQILPRPFVPMTQHSWIALALAILFGLAGWMSAWGGGLVKTAAVL